MGSHAEQLIVSAAKLRAVAQYAALQGQTSGPAAFVASIAGEDSKELIDREIFYPWLRFLWETYRTVLEVTRINTRLEHLYKETAEQAFDYCLKYERANEFRRLAELLRAHHVTIMTV